MELNVELLHGITQTLYREASLLDEHRYDDWLDMLTEDMTYWMPIRSTRLSGDEASEFTAPGEGAYYDDTKEMLKGRVFKLSTGFAWSEIPRSRSRHIISNLKLRDVEQDGEVGVDLNFIVYRTRLDVKKDIWVGRRFDRLRKVDGDWLISRREIYLDQTVLTSNNLSTLF